MAREPPGVEQVDVLRDGAQSVLHRRADGESIAPILRNRLRRRPLAWMAQPT
jgi:hypothetical protein